MIILEAAVGSSLKRCRARSTDTADMVPYVAKPGSLAYSGEPNVIMWVSVRGNQESQSRRRRLDRTEIAVYRITRIEDGGTGPQAKGCRYPPATEEEGIGLTQSLWQELSPCQHLDFRLLISRTTRQ